MTIHIKNYLKELSIWPMIVDYILDHLDQYTLVNKSNKVQTLDQQIFETIKQNARRTLSPYKEYDSFRHALTNLYQEKTLTLSRENVYRLFFVLGLSDDSRANTLCTMYLNQHELSARSIDEFIITCALRIQLSWEDTCLLRTKYKKKLDDYPVAPLQFTENVTYHFYKNVIISLVKTREDLVAVLEDKNHLAFWARTRNSPYFALFFDMDWLSKTSINRLTSIKLYQMPLSVSEATDESATISMWDYFLTLFGLHSVDDTNDISPDSYLTVKEIHALATIYPSVFMTYETFCDLVQRRRTLDISSGTYILRMLEGLSPYPEDENEYTNFANRKDFLSTCENHLLSVGFPSLKRNSIFSKLILDIYDETLNEIPSATSSVVKEMFFKKLRYYLKQIANQAESH